MLSPHQRRKFVWTRMFFVKKGEIFFYAVLWDLNQYLLRNDSADFDSEMKIDFINELWKYNRGDTEGISLQNL